MPYHNLQHDRHWVIPHWTGNYVVRISPVGGVTEAEQQATRRVLFVLLHDSRSGDQHARRVLREIYGALYPNSAPHLETFKVFGPTLGDVRESEQALRVAEAIERAALMGLLAIVPDVRPTMYVAPKPLPDALGPSESAPAEPVHFIELELVDGDERPVGGEPYSIKLPDGRTVNGRLDSGGRATVTGIKDPGSCQVSFPNLDVSVWG